MVQSDSESQRAVRVVLDDARNAARADQNLFHDESRRPASESFSARSSELPNSAREHDPHRHAGGDCRRAHTDSRIERAREHGDAARVRPRVLWCVDPAEDCAGYSAAVQNSWRSTRANSRSGFLPDADGRPPCHHLGAAGDLAGARHDRVLRLREAERAAHSLGEDGTPGHVAGKAGVGIS